MFPHFCPNRTKLLVTNVIFIEYLKVVGGVVWKGVHFPLTQVHIVGPNFEFDSRPPGLLYLNRTIIGFAWNWTQMDLDLSLTIWAKAWWCRYDTNFKIIWSFSSKSLKCRAHSYYIPIHSLNFSWKCSCYDTIKQDLMWTAFINEECKNFIFQWYFAGLGINSGFSLHELMPKSSAFQCPR